MKSRSFFVLSVLGILFVLSALAPAGESDWAYKPLEGSMPGRGTLKGIRYPQDKPVPVRSDEPVAAAKPQIALDEAQADGITGTVASLIDSPPIDGFIPWITITTTRENSGELELVAVPKTGPIPSYLRTSTDPNALVVGIFDTGASAHVFSNAAGNSLNLYGGGYMTTNELDISGVTGSVSARVSKPIGVYIDGLYAANSYGLGDTSAMVGETNTAVVVGKTPPPGGPDLPNAIGTPLSVYYTAVIKNETPVTRSYGGQEYTAPHIRFYEQGDPAIPEYDQIIPLELRPLGAVNVQYTISLDFLDLLDPFGNFSYEPGTPSIIIGNLSQSVFFVHSVDIYHGMFSALDKTRFMLDTGAQVTTIGKRIAARLNLNPNTPDFEVEIQGVTGDISYEPGFYIDELRIPALGGWQIFRNVPVVLLDVFSPEGGTVDGIIGMNLFNEFNMVLAGGGLFLIDDPYLALDRFTAEPMAGDIAPEILDGQVNILDVAAMGSAWMATPAASNWNPRADLAPVPFHDQLVNWLDYSLMSRWWLASGN